MSRHGTLISLIILMMILVGCSLPESSAKNLVLKKSSSISEFSKLANFDNNLQFCNWAERYSSVAQEFTYYENSLNNTQVGNVIATDIMMPNHNHGEINNFLYLEEKIRKPRTPICNSRAEYLLLNANPMDIPARIQYHFFSSKTAL